MGTATIDISVTRQLSIARTDSVQVCVCKRTNLRLLKGAEKVRISYPLQSIL